MAVLAGWKLWSDGLDRTLSGQVFDPQGQPVAGAQILWLGQTTESTQEGEFSVGYRRVDLPALLSASSGKLKRERGIDRSVAERPVRLELAPPPELLPPPETTPDAEPLRRRFEPT